MTAAVWLIFPSERKSSTADVRRAIVAACAEREWPTQQRSTTLIAESSGKKTRVLPSEDAHALYRQMHRTRVAVLTFQSPQVCLRRDVHTSVLQRETVGLGRYCRYKAFFHPMNFETDDPRSWIALFDTWCQTSECDGEYDPRCLPLHVFSASNASLDTVAERNAFEAKYGHGRSRQDDRTFVWKIDPKAFHGRDVLVSGGCSLPRGFHWDVNVESRPLRIRNGVSEWLVSRYVNIHPDAHIVGRAPYAKEV